MSVRSVRSAGFPVLARPDHPGRGFRHFVPRTLEVAKWFGDHEAGLTAQAVQDLDLGVQCAQFRDLGGVEQ